MAPRWLYSRGLLLIVATSTAAWLVLSSVVGVQAVPHSVAAPPPAASMGGWSALLGTAGSMGSAPHARVPANLFQQMVRAHDRQTVQARSDTTCSQNPAPGYLHTTGIWIEDSNNCHVRLAGATWYGMQTTLYEPAGLDFLPYTTIIALIKKFGFNSVRLPFSNQMVEQNSTLTISKRYLGANKGLNGTPNLLGLHPLQLLDLIVKACQEVGLMVILDDHFTKARTPSSYGVTNARPAVAGSAGLSRKATVPDTWSGADYISTQTWINDWLTLTARYSPATPCGNENCSTDPSTSQPRTNPAVIGFDIRNEPHTDFVGKRHHWNLKDYLSHGATWGHYPSKNWKAASNWQQAATAGGDAILAANPNLLIFVEGVQLYPDPTNKYGVETYWWGGILRGVAHDPVILSVPHQMVYSPHEWGPWKCCGSGQFSRKTTFKSMAKVFRQNWGFILHSHNLNVRAPIWLGEFNTCNTYKKCAADKKKGSQGQWFQIVIKYLKQNPEVGWSYYPINGTTSFDQPSDNSILNRYWTKPQIPAVMTALRSIEK